jgi:hypothetical protein
MVRTYNHGPGTEPTHDTCKSTSRGFRLVLSRVLAHGAATVKRRCIGPRLLRSCPGLVQLLSSKRGLCAEQDTMGEPKTGSSELYVPLRFFK